MSESRLSWTYTLRNVSPSKRPDWVETYETMYGEKPVFVSVHAGGHGGWLEEDVLKVVVYSSPEKRDFIGLQTIPKPLQGPFLSSLIFIEQNPKGEGQQPIKPQNAPKLEDFVKQYKPIFESYRDLREKFKDFL